MPNPKSAKRPSRAKHPKGWPESGTGQRIWTNVLYRPMAEGIKKRLMGEGYLDVSIGFLPGKGGEPDSYAVWYHPEKKRRPPPEGFRYDAKGNVLRIR